MLTAFVIEVAAKETASIVGKYSINANHVATVWILSFKVPINIVIPKRLKFSIRTFYAFIFLFVAKLPEAIPGYIPADSHSCRSLG